ncbi:hypothetical protein ACIQNG_36305 [Streptomyces sp. NPDC091377]|uniref:hypothetical protein n=1 Tax=Streptomyces sp. NPDC091377 TaxID=3365995 RepID=UPI003830B946
MVRGRDRRGWGALAVCGVLLTGCTDGGDSDGDGTGGAEGARPNATGVTVAEPGKAKESSEPLDEMDPERQPETAEQARALIGKVIAGPDLFTPEVRRATPYESDPSRWAVLGENCTWRREPLPRDVLGTLTRYFEVPARGGRGEVRLTATVTVHHTVTAAAWEQAGMLEEAVGCGEQTLTAGARLTGLTSLATKWGEGNNGFSDDSLMETGKCVSEEHGGPYPYWWSQATYGPVVASTSVCGGEGYDLKALQEIVQEALPRMLLRVQDEVGRPAEGKAGSASPSVSKEGE